MNEEFSKALYEMDFFQLFWAFLGVFIVGGMLSFWLFCDPRVNIFQSAWNYINELPIDDSVSFLSLAAKILATLVGISVPISLTIVSRNLKTYKDKWVSKLLFQELAFKAQISFTLPLICILLFFVFAKLINPFILILCFLAISLSLYFFYKFLRLMVKYATQTDEIVLEKIKIEINEILE